MIDVGLRKLVLVILSLGQPASDAVAQRGSRLWRPEERVVLTDYRTVEAVAADDAMVYAVTTGGMVVYDHRFRRFEIPLAATDVAHWAPVRDAVADPTDRSLWLATELGVANYQPALQRFELVLVPGGAVQLWLDPADPFAGVYLRDRTGWQVLPRAGVVPVPARPPAAGSQQSAVGRQLSALSDRYPALTTLSARILTDQGMRSYRFTSATEVPVTGDVFLGTDGLGLVRFDPSISDFEILRFGLLTVGAGAVGRSSGGVWVAGSDMSSGPAVTFVGDDLQRFEYIEGPRVRGFAGSVVYDLLALERELWMATDAGIVVLDGGSDPRSVTSSDGLPSARVHALAAAPHGVWLGTDRGLALAADGLVKRIGEAIPINDLAATGDSVWVATPMGLGLTVAGVDRVVEVPGAYEVPELQDELTAVGVMGGRLVVATRDRVAWRERAAGSRQPEARGGWTLERRINGELGPLTCLVVDRNGVWVGGGRGFALFRFDSRQFTFFNAPDDVPGPVRDLVADERYLWVAADRGVVRFERGAVWP